MQGGFSFCGVDIAKLGLEYVPTLDQTYVFSGSAYEVHQEVFDAHHGGYYYGATVQPKDFTLKCLYQDQKVIQGNLSVIENVFRRGRTGRLIFQQREWLWYAATVVNVDLMDLRNYQNGFVTITLRAYYPFARHDHLYIDDNNMFDKYIELNTGLLSSAETPTTSIGPITENTDFLLYNGGSERAGVAIAIAGEAGEDGVTITNHTTGHTAKFVAFTKALTSGAGKYIVSDAINGKTVLTDGTQSERSFIYHDHGFIELAPSFPIERNVYVSCKAGSNQISVIGDLLLDNVVGRHIMIDGAWSKIIGLTENTLTVDRTISADDACYTNIVTMNEISVTLSAGAELTKFDVVYKPTFQ